MSKELFERGILFLLFLYWRCYLDLLCLLCKFRIYIYIYVFIPQASGNLCMSLLVTLTSTFIIMPDSYPLQPIACLVCFYF